MLLKTARQTKQDLIYGIALILSSSWIGELIILLVCFTPDPNNKIRYGLLFIILGVLALMFGVGLYKLDKVDKTLNGILEGKY